MIDNFEHLLDAAPLVGRLLRSGPRLRLLVTSRAPLHLTAEREYQVAPLRVPDVHATTLEELEGVESVRLFVQRAEAVMPGFELSPDNAAAVARICRALDGLPLAIELAAARIRVLGPDGMATRIGERLALLTRRAPDLAARQRSLRATIEWSVRLLDEPARAAFGVVGVFSAPASLVAIERVVGDRIVDVPEAIEALLDASLVISEADASGEPRFRMLETIREYALEELGASGGRGAPHGTHTSTSSSTPCGSGTRHRRGDPNDRGKLESIDAIYPDVVAALRHATATEAVASEFQLLSLVWRYWSGAAIVEDAHHHLDAATASDDARIPRSGRRAMRCLAPPSSS